MDPDLLSGFLPGDASPMDQLLSDLPDRNLTTSVDDKCPSKNEALTIHAQGFVPGTASSAGAVISKIEDMFESIIDCIQHEKKELVIELRSRPRSKGNTVKGSLNFFKNGTNTDMRAISFPSRSPQEAWKFTTLLRILELSHEALVTGIVTTKRDIYYRDPELFMKQSVVDRYVDDIAYTLGVDRDALNVVAAAKGLVVGSFKIRKKGGSMVDYGTELEAGAGSCRAFIKTNNRQGILIPSYKEIDNAHLHQVRWILVVEKEAKGYPDIQTRKFLHFLATHHAQVPIFALVDFDPDGIGIMSTYKYGSINLAHEKNLAVPSMQWLGVRSRDFLQTEKEVRGLLSLTARDRRIAVKMLERAASEDGHIDWEWQRELQVMIMLNMKAEIQILGNGTALAEWLDERLLHAV